MTWNMPILNILVVRQNLRDPSVRGFSWDIEKSGCFWGKFVPVYKRISKRVLNVARRPILLFRQLQLSIWSNVSSFWGFWDFRRTRTGQTKSCKCKGWDHARSADTDIRYYVLSLLDVTTYIYSYANSKLRGQWGNYRTAIFFVATRGSRLVKQTTSFKRCQEADPAPRVLGPHNMS